MASRLIKSEHELLLSTISWLRFPLIIAVVFIHLNPNVDIQLINYKELKWIDLYRLIATLCSHVIPIIAVPCFFMFSGFLYFFKMKEWNKTVYLTKTKKRIYTLVIPYILWNMIPIFLNILYKTILGDLDGYLATIVDGGVLKVFWNYHEAEEYINLLGWKYKVYYPINIPLWFLRDLIVVVILSPLVYYFVRNTKYYGVILLGVLYYFRIWVFIPGFSIQCLFFFSFGAYFSINKKSFITVFNRNKEIWFIMMLTSIVLVTYYDNTYMNAVFYPMFIISGIASVVIIISNLLLNGKVKVNQYLAKTSFFIYVMHTVFFLSFFMKLLNYVFPEESVFLMILKYFLTPLFVAISCLFLYGVMRKIAPRILMILTGGR